MQIVVRCIWRLLLPLLDLGYQVDVRIMNSVHYGVPQQRRVSNILTHTHMISPVKGPVLLCRNILRTERTRRLSAFYSLKILLLSCISQSALALSLPGSPVSVYMPFFRAQLGD